MPVFSTGYRPICRSSALCGADDDLIDGDSHASIYDATRRTASQIIAFRHNAREPAQKLERLPAGQRNRLVVVEGLYSIRGDVAPLRQIVDVCRANGAYLMVDEAHSLGAFGPTGLGCAEAQGVCRVDFIVGTFSKSLEASVASPSRITRNCARFSREGMRVHGVWIARQRGERGGRGRRDSHYPELSTVGEHPAISRRTAGAGLSHRTTSRRSCRSSPARNNARSHSGGAARGRALRESDRAARLPRDPCVLRASCSAAQRRADHASLDVFERVSVQPHGLVACPR
jgi:hypothetical protein